MTEIFREVDEDVRRDQMLKLWRAYGKYAVAVAMAVVLGVAGSVGWKEYSLRQRQAMGMQFSQALDLLHNDQAALAAERFAELAENAGDGYATLARLREAEARAAAGESDQAVAILDALAGDGAVDPELRDLAGLLAVLHLLDQGSSGDLGQRLEPLLDPGSAWFASAREISGLVAFRRGETESARTIFAELAADSSAPRGIRSRAADLLAILGGGGAGP